MTVLEGYFAKIDDYPEDELKLCVSRSYPFFVKRHKMTLFTSLTPSDELLKDYKAGKVTWGQYTDRFKDEMRRQVLSRHNLEWLKRRDKSANVRLLCYEKAEDRRCHRFLLLDILESMEEEE